MLKTPNAQNEQHRVQIFSGSRTEETSTRGAFAPVSQSSRKPETKKSLDAFDPISTISDGAGALGLVDAKPLGSISRSSFLSRPGIAGASEVLKLRRQRGNQKNKCDSQKCEARKTFGKWSSGLLSQRKQRSSFQLHSRAFGGSGWIPSFDRSAVFQSGLHNHLA